MDGITRGLRTYTVQPLDTLPGVSKKVYGSPDFWQHIYDANRNYIPNPNQLYPGMVIVLPHLTPDSAVGHVLRQVIGHGG